MDSYIHSKKDGAITHPITDKISRKGREKQTRGEGEWTIIPERLTPQADAKKTRLRYTRLYQSHNRAHLTPKPCEAIRGVLSAWDPVRILRLPIDQRLLNAIDKNENQMRSKCDPM